jgi:hypothetical protein
MTATLFSAVVTCVVSLFVGQAALRLAGAREWNWLAPAVGLSVVMLVATPMNDVPGRAVTGTVIAGILAVAAIVWCGLTREHRPPLAGLVAVIPVALLVLIPFLAVGSVGVLGVSMDNDMGAHMFFVETYLSAAAQSQHPALVELYPLGPHGMVALISQGFSIRVDHAFTGWSMAIPIITGWTALALLRRGGWIKQTVLATVAALPFLVTAYYAEGSFKEVVQAGLVLAVVAVFAGRGPALDRGRWVPLALLLGGIVSVYSVTGLAWPIVLGGLWLAGIAVQRIVRSGIEGVWDEVRGGLPAVGVGLGVFVISVIPQAVRIGRFITDSIGSGGIIVPMDSLGNHVAPLPIWEGFGIWSNPDFRLPAVPAFTSGMWTAFVVVLVVLGAWWMLRRGRWMLPLAAAGSLLIWQVSKDSQSPYVVAKALVVVSPLLLMIAVLPLLEQLPDRTPRKLSALIRDVPGQPLSWGVAALLLAVLTYKVVYSDVQALRVTPVGPSRHVDELRDLRPSLDHQPTLYLGNDEFVRWALAGMPVDSAIFGAESDVPLRAGKAWTNGEALDFDLVDAKTLNKYRYVITTNDAAGSQPPPQMHLVRRTSHFALWRREGQVRQRAILPERGMPGMVLDCNAERGRAILRGGGVAAVRPKPVEAPGALLPPGGTVSVELPLAAGRWDITSAYISRLPVEVSAPGLSTTLPGSLDRLGPRLPIGRLTVRGGQSTVLDFRVGDTLLAPNTPVTDLHTVVATPVAPEQIVPIGRACGRYVDWYRSARPDHRSR